MSGDIEEAAELLRPVVESAIHALMDQYDESALEAAGHLKDILNFAINDNTRHVSLYQRATYTPPLMDDLVSGQNHPEVAVRWNTSEASVRRARNKLKGK